MRASLNHVHKVFIPASKAADVAAELNANAKRDGDDWTYTVVPNPTDAEKSAIIAIHDEAGGFVAYL